jgi:hypothetical protein
LMPRNIAQPNGKSLPSWTDPRHQFNALVSASRAQMTRASQLQWRRSALIPRQNPPLIC